MWYNEEKGGSEVRLEEYISEIQKVEMLEPEEERELWRRFKEESRQGARQKLIESYQPLVFKVVIPYRTMTCVMDLVQEGTVGLIEAVEGYKPERGVAFSLYAVHRIRGRMLEYLRREGKAERASGEEMGEIEDEGERVEEIAERNEMIDRLRVAVERLPERERRVIEGIYLQSMDFRILAERLRVSVGHVYRLHKQGIRRVRGMLSRFIGRFE